MDYSSLFDAQGNDKSSADDIAKLTCGEIAAIPFGKPITKAKLVRDKFEKTCAHIPYVEDFQLMC